MPFPADRVGLLLEQRQKDVAVRDILAYAAGLGASEDAFLDDVRAGGLIALPMQCVSLEWPVVVSLRAILGDRLTPDEARGGVHAVQDSIFHRPIVPGDQLVTDGQLVSARQIPSGVLVVCRLETRERDGRAPVTTSWTSSVYRGVALEGDPITVADPPASAVPFELPSNAEAVTIPIAREAPHIYSECADIWNPIHTERQVALAAGLPDIILHGTITWALAGLTILRRYAESDGARLKRLSGRFTGMVIPGENITIRHARAEGDVVWFEVATETGKLAISQGAAWIG